ncbi:MAG: ComEC family competence protein, partial [Alphaproteobacteria bacterium]|nr:ComEC family competence protein [Alphaproteobacteria bacterium]
MQFLETLLNQRDRWILWTPVAMAFGIGGYFSLRFEPPLWVGIAAVGVLAVGISPFYRNKKVVLFWLLFFLIALGFTAAQVRTWNIGAPVLTYRTYPLVLEGRIAAVDALPKGYRVILDQLRYDESKRLPQNPMPERVRVKLKK